jgi:protein SCO1
MIRRLIPFAVLIAAGCGAWGGPTAPVPPAEPNLDYPVGKFTLAERSGKTVTDDDLRGKVWVASFIFTRCAGPCPSVTAAMARLQTDLKDELNADKVKLVTFTVDPARDDLKALNDYANARGAHPDHWLFLTGEEETIHTLMRERFKLMVGRNEGPDVKPGDEFGHSTKLVLVDRNGTIRAMYEGLPDDRFPDGQERFEAGLVRLKARVRELIK